MIAAKKLTNRPTDQPLHAQPPCQHFQEKVNFCRGTCQLLPYAESQLFQENTPRVGRLVSWSVYFHALILLFSKC